VRVLYSFPDRLGGSAGINVAALHQILGLLDLGIEVVLYCTSLHREIRSAAGIVRTLSVGSVRIPHRVLGRQRSYRYHDWRVARALPSIGGIDLVHCWPQATVQTCTAARTLGIKTIREVPNTHTAHAFEVVTRERQKLGMQPVAGHSHTFAREVLELEEEEYRLADCLLVPSEYSKQTFLERGFEPRKLALHQFGFDPDMFFPRQHAADSGRPLRALFAGRGEARKGLHYALDAWLASGVPARGGRLAICGNFIPGYREVLGDRLNHPSIDLLGYVSDLGAVMRAHDIFLYPAIEDGSALVTYMAQGSGCVLVVSEAAGARCVHGIDGLVHTPGDVRTLTEHIQLLDRDRSLLARLGTAAARSARELTWKRAAEQLADIYRQTVECPTGGSGHARRGSSLRPVPEDHLSTSQHRANAGTNHN
jgi:glycosyltransferase involved in cell wall biosynthesis